MLFTLKGIIPAVWTPTGADGLLLKDALRRNLDLILASPIDSLLALGSTGEFIQLSIDQRKEVLETIIAHAGSTPVLVNISDTNPRNIRELGRHAKHSGAVAVSLLPPWFFPMNDDDLVEFFVAAAEAIELPLILYNFKAMTGKCLTPEIVRRIASRVQIGGLKQSAGNLQEHQPLTELGREFHFNVVTGWDTHIPETTALGAKGCVAGLANVVPELLTKIFALVESGQVEELREPARRMRRIGEAISVLEFPHNVAAAMEARGLEVGAPKSIQSAATRARYASLLANMKKLLSEFGII